MPTPTPTNGLKGKVRQMVLQMDAERSHRQRARDVNLRHHLAQMNLEPGHLYAELGIDPYLTTVAELMADDDNKYLLPEIIRDGIRQGIGLAQRESLSALRRVVSQGPVLSEAGGGGQRFISPDLFLDPVLRGAVQSVFYPDLVIREVTVTQPSVTVPHLDLSDASVRESEEGATIEEGTVTYGSKDVKIGKETTGIKISYEAIMFNTIDLVSLFFIDLGRLLGNRLNGKCVTVLIDGDQEDGSEAAAIIGVEDTAAGFQYIDVTRVWIRFSLLGQMSTSIIGNETTANNYLNLPEVKDKQFVGNPLLQTMLKTPLPTQQDLYVSPKVGANKLVFQDSSISLVQLTAQALMVETEKIVQKQLAGTYASIWTGFAKLQRRASLILDKSIAFSGNGFPAWLSPFNE